MEDEHGTYNHEEAIKGMNINLGNEDIDSNGHRDGMEPLEIVETTTSLKMEVHNYRAYNERLIRSQKEKKNR